MKFRQSIAVPVALALAGSLALGACTSNAGTPTPTAAPTSTAPTKTAPPLAPEPSFVDNKWEGAANDVDFQCPLKEGHHDVEVTVKNSAAEARDYAIYIIWMPQNETTVLGSGFVAVKDVKPGEERKATVSADVVSKPDRCAENVKVGKIAE